MAETLTEGLARVARKHRTGTDARFEEYLDRSTSGAEILISELVDQELVEDAPFMEGVASLAGLAHVPDPVPDKEDEARLSKLCPPGLGLKRAVLPLSLFPLGFAVEGEEQEFGVLLATSNPFDLLARQEVASRIQIPVRWCVSPRRKLATALKAFYGVGGETVAELLVDNAVQDNDLEFGGETSVIDGDDEDAAVNRFVNQILQEAIAQQATDIHVEPLEKSLRIRYRIDGILHEVPVPENIKALQNSVLASIKVRADLDIAEHRLPQDGRINLSAGGKPLDVRVATVPSVEGESISLRLLQREQFSIDRLGMEPELRATVERLIKLPDGIVLVTGPTGCGKSTSLYTFLSALNREMRRIITIEDPVEHKLPGVVQIAVDQELTFAKGLRSILRADPNVIMVGEIRDLETAEIAIRSALTGHMVFSTLHTNDAIGGITRLVDMGVEPFLVGSSVRAFIAQRLVRKLCLNCRVPAPLPPEQLLIYGDGEGIEGAPFAAGKGCQQCQGRGYKGRLAIFEVCEITPELEEAIMAGAGRNDILQIAQADGFRTMREYGWARVLDGGTTIQEILSATAGRGEAGF